MSSIGWQAINDQLLSWCRQATGLDDSHCYLAGQGTGRPASGAFITIGRPRVRQLGQADETRVQDDGVNGFRRHTKGPRLITITITCYAPVGATDAAAPEALLAEVIALGNSESMSDSFEAAGFGISDFSDVLPIDGVINSTMLEPRAHFDVMGFVASELIETLNPSTQGTYIGTVQIAGTMDPEPDTQNIAPTIQ